jgi:hypothetical protein
LSGFAHLELNSHGRTIQTQLCHLPTWPAATSVSAARLKAFWQASGLLLLVIWPA